MGRDIRKHLLLVLLFSFFCTLAQNYLYEFGYQNRLRMEGIENQEFRSKFFSEEMRRDKDKLSAVCKNFLDAAVKDSVYFPIPESLEDPSLTISYVDSWMGERSYKGKSVHEGTDLMAGKNQRGLYPVLSISDGVITNLGWLEKGGWRIGVTSPSGVYYYYAHLESYADIREGDRVKAGQLLGFMGDSGYGKEGTLGKFDVHLHLGIYCFRNGKEVSVNPYYLLRFLEDKKLKYRYL